jgi:2-dehydropantoate 2-reductase
MERLGVLAFGAGAIGTYVGGSLALAGHKVTYIEQPAAAAELTQRGLVLDLTIDRRRWTADDPSSAVYRPSPVDFVSSLEVALSRGPFDVAIFALKSFDTATALEGMRPFADRLPPILCLSNGVDNEPALAAVLGPDKVIAGTVTSAVGRRGVGDIVLERLRGVGLADGHPLSLAVTSALEEAHLNPRLYPRPADMKWSKMLTNLMVNASVAILDLPPRQVLADPRLFTIEIAMLREALAVMRAQGIRVVDTPKTPVRLLALAASLPAFISRPLMVKAVGGGRGGKMPSFHIDLHAGRGKSEVDWLNGAVVRYGEKFGVRTPVNRVLNETLLALTRGEIALGEFRGRPERLVERVRSKKLEGRRLSGKA